VYFPLDSGTLLHTLDLENSAMTGQSLKSVIKLHGSSEKGGRSQRDKLEHRRSTKLTIPPSSNTRPLVYHSDCQALFTARFRHVGHISDS